MGFSIGHQLRLTLFGESHGPAIGFVLDGLPAGLKISKEETAAWMERRRPAQSIFTTQRRERDDVIFLSGLREDHTNGGAVSGVIYNQDVISKHYDEIRDNPRPGHGDLTMFLKYGEWRPYEGGGFLSGRMTAPIVAAGSICLQVLNRAGIEIVSWIEQIGEVRCDHGPPQGQDGAYAFDTRMPDGGECDARASLLLRDTLSEGDSLGARIATEVRGGVPAGVGDPIFDSVEGEIARFMFSIPGLKGIEFGRGGFGFAGSKGSEVVDEIFLEDGIFRTRSNNNGGILGGITNGMPIRFDVVMKPTSSIRKPPQDGEPQDR